MATKLQELLQNRAEAITSMKRILDVCDNAHRSLTVAEDKEYKSLDEKVDQINEQLAKRSKIEGFDPTAHIVNPFLTSLQSVTGKGETGGFRNLGELCHSIYMQKKEQVMDSRLDALRAEQREQSFGVGAQGGFAVPEQFRPDLMMVSPQDAIVMPRATVIPAGSPPDARISMPSLDQTSGQNMYGGVSMVHTGEALTLTETSANLRQVSMEPKKIAGYIVVTNELLNNWDAASEVLSNLMLRAISGQFDYDCLRGNGVNQAIGVIDAPAAIVQNRAAAGIIAFPDVYNMMAKLKFGGSPVWIASQTTIPQLASMVDAGSHAVWMGGQGDGLPGAQGSIPKTLFGFPLLFSDRLPALGSKGDIILADLSYYLIKLGSGPDIAVADQLLFLTDRVVFRVTWRVDGKPWLTEPLALEGAATSFVSPFVVLSA